jgi:hypothetical protein
MSNYYGKATASRLGAAQTVAVTSTSAASTAFGSQTYQVLLTATALCQIRISDGTQTAVTTDTYLPANWPMIFACTPGQKVAAVTASSATLSVTELS